MDPCSSVELKANLEKQISRSLEKLSSPADPRKPRGGFVTMKFLEETFRSQVLSEVLKGDFPELDLNTLQVLEYFIRTKSPRV
jgi:hypothetical protein